MLRGLRQYAAIMAMLPAGANEIVRQTEIGRDHVVDTMRRLKRYGAVYIHSWHRESKGHKWAEVWAVSIREDHEDAPHPGFHRGRPGLVRDASSRYRIEAHAFANLVIALRDGHTILSLMDLTGLDRNTVARLVSVLRSLSVIRVSEWERQPAGQPMRIYRLGSGRDAPRPAPSSSADINRVYRARRSARDRTMKMATMMAAPLAQASAIR